MSTTVPLQPVPHPWWAAGPLLTWWKRRQEDAYPQFWPKGMAPCSEAEYHNIKRSTHRCTWCGLSINELAIVGAFGRSDTTVPLTCPTCRTAQRGFPNVAKRKGFLQILPHSVGRRRCKGSHKEIRG